MEIAVRNEVTYAAALCRGRVKQFLFAMFFISLRKRVNEILRKARNKKRPIRVSVWDQENLDRVARACHENDWIFVAKIDPDEDEYLTELVAKLQYEQGASGTNSSIIPPNLDPKPNNFCPCGSNRKYKKCCMLPSPTVPKLPPEIRPEI